MKFRKESLVALLLLQGISLLGGRLSSLAIGIWIVKEQGMVTPLLLIPLFSELPKLVFGIWIGLAVDKWNRKTVLVLGDGGQAIGTLLLLICISRGDFELWLFYSIVIFQGFFASFQEPAMNATISLAVSEKNLDRINALRELLFPLAGILAPFLAGLLFFSIGLSGIIVIDLFTFVVSVIVLSQLKLPETTEYQLGKEGLWLQASKGFFILYKNKGLFVLTLYFIFWDFLLNGPLELVIPFVLHRSNSDLILSWILGFMNVGALIGALITVCGLTFRKRLVPMFLGVILTSSMFIVFGISTNVWVMGVSLTFLMLPLAMTGSLYTSLIQINVPNEYQGRVFAAIGQLTALSAPLSFIITGPLVDQWLEPLMTEGYLPWMSAIFGKKEGAGIGFLLSFVGVLLFLGTIPVLLIRKVRKLEFPTSKLEKFQEIETKDR